MEKSILTARHFYFIGIAGTGMSAIAQYLKGTGKSVSGSDRFFNEQQKEGIQVQLEKAGIECYKQDGSGIHQGIDIVIISTAIEQTNTEYQKAIALSIPVYKRSELLAAIANHKSTIAIAGTSGKSTTTAMLFHLMEYAGYQPSLITGAGLTSLQKKDIPGNAWVGKGDWLVIEADESDGSIIQYKPQIGVLLNIDRDHKEMDELQGLFHQFRDHTKQTFIVNRDHPVACSFSTSLSNDFAYKQKAGIQASDFQQNGFSITFKVQDTPFNIPLIGQHNMENALAAIAAGHKLGLGLDMMSEALKSFEGIYRRTQLVGKKNGITVIDDFAHNPAEIVAAIQTCQAVSGSVMAWFQPHGFGPLRFFHQELVSQVAETLRDSDIFLLSDVYYAGGTVEKDIQSDQIAEAIKNKGGNVIYYPGRDTLFDRILPKCKPGDLILLMGARDPSLSDFAKQILNKI